MVIADTPPKRVTFVFLFLVHFRAYKENTMTMSIEAINLEYTQLKQFVIDNEKNISQVAACVYEKYPEVKKADREVFSWAYIKSCKSKIDTSMFK